MKRRQIILCWITIGLAITAILMTLFVRIIPTITITGETYIGVLVSLLAICVTFAIGYQIVNTLDLKESVKEMRELRDDLEETKNCIVDSTYGAHGTIETLRGEIQSEKGHYLLAICHYMRAIKDYIMCNSAIDVDAHMRNAKTFLGKWDEDGTKAFECPYRIGGEHIEKVVFTTIDRISDEFKENELYRLIKSDLSDIKNKLSEKIQQHKVKIDNKQ